MNDEAEILRQFVATAPTGLLMLDRKLINLQASRRWIETFGRKLYIQGRHHYETCPDIPPHWKKAHQRALEGEVVRCSGERLVRDDKEYWIAWEVVPWGRDGGKPEGIIISVEDITPRVRAAEALRENRDALESLLAQYQDAVCKCQGKSSHAPTCWAHPTAPVIARAEQALRELSRLEDQMRIKPPSRSRRHR